ncbi:MAG: hypothetical protein WCS88_01465 [Patescibacteria group bacterium]|jgi:hypothetical protein
MPALDTTLDQDDFQETPEEQDFGSLQGASNKAVARDLEQIKRQAREKISKEWRDKIVKEVAKKVSVRAASWGAGATGVGLLVTFGIWTVQAIGGNLMGSKWIPKLELYELILWLILGVLLAAIVLLALTLLTILVDPIGFGLDLAWDTITSLFD